jgi:hypothetical protein
MAWTFANTARFPRFGSHLLPFQCIYMTLCGIVGWVLSLLSLKSVFGPRGCFMYVL